MTALPSPAAVLPHGPAFRFVDEIVSLDGDRIVAARQVPLNEPWTGAHFPDEALVPGVLLIEGMAQTCGLLARLREGGGPAVGGRLAAVRSARFHRPVRPGARLLYHAQWCLQVGGLHRFTVETLCDDERVAEAELVLAIDTGE